MLIIVDGLDGAGKSSAIEMLRKKLSSIGLTSAVVSGIGSGQIGSHLRYKIVTQEYATEAMKLIGFPLAILDAIKTAEELLKTNNVVIMDRGPASYATYSILNEVTSPTIIAMLQLLGLELTSFSKRGNIKLVKVFLKTSSEVCIQRLKHRRKVEYMDKASLEEFKRIEHNFEVWFDMHGSDPTLSTFTITNDSTIEDLEIELNSLVDRILV